jgi:hypothetical protein
MLFSVHSKVDRKMGHAVIECVNQHWNAIFCLLLLTERRLEKLFNRNYKLLFKLINQLRYLHELYIFHHEIVLETNYIFRSPEPIGANGVLYKVFKYNMKSKK